MKCRKPLISHIGLFIHDRKSKLRAVRFRVIHCYFECYRFQFSWVSSNSAANIEIEMLISITTMRHKPLIDLTLIDFWGLSSISRYLYQLWIIPQRIHQPRLQKVRGHWSSDNIIVQWLLIQNHNGERESISMTQATRLSGIRVLYFLVSYESNGRNSLAEVEDFSGISLHQTQESKSFFNWFWFWESGKNRSLLYKNNNNYLRMGNKKCWPVGAYQISE